MNVPLFVAAGTAAWMLAGVALASALGPRLRRCGELAGGASDARPWHPGAEAGGVGGRRGLARWTLPGSVAAFAFASSTGLAAAGVLPPPAQGVARSVLSTVRLEVPAATDDRAEPAVAVPGTEAQPAPRAAESAPSPRAGAARPDVAPRGSGASSSTDVEPPGLVRIPVGDAPARAPEPAVKAGGDGRDTIERGGADERAGSVEPQDPAPPRGRPDTVPPRSGGGADERAGSVEPQDPAPPRGRPDTVPPRSERPAADPVPADRGAPDLADELDDTDDRGAPGGGPGETREGRDAPAASPTPPRAEVPPGLAPGKPDTPARHEPPPGARPDHPGPPAGEPEARTPPGPPAGTPADAAAAAGGRGRPAHAVPGGPDRPGHPHHEDGIDRPHPGRGRGLPEPAVAEASQTSLPESPETVVAQPEG